MSEALSGTVGRWQLRDLARTVLLNNTLAGPYVYTSRDTEQAPDDVPAIRIYAPLKNSSWRGDSVPSFTARVTLVIVAIVSGASLAICESQVDLMVDQIEFALLTGVAFMGALQRVVKVETQVKHEVRDRHLATMSMAVECEYVDRFAPNLIAPTLPNYIGGNTLASMSIRGDMGSNFDSDLSLPNAGTLDTGVVLKVPPAPRTTGPDGRVDVGADFDVASSSN